MNDPNYIARILLWITGAYVFGRLAFLFWAARTIAELEQQVKRLNRPPEVRRDLTGRPIKERK